MTINCGGKLLDLSSPKVMAICNITGNSFYVGSRVSDEGSLIKMVNRHLEEGADIIDIGGMSSRPGAKEIPLEDEIDKLTWALRILRKEFPEIIISIDTYRSGVVTAAIPLGINMINDISGGALDSQLITTIGQTNLPYILMHMKGRPETMQNDTTYEKDIVLSELDYFKSKVHECAQAGIKDIIIDPGFGFGKSLNDNYRMLHGLSAFSLFELPLMVGLSRKSMIYKVLGVDSEHALNGTSALHMLALQNDAKLLRVHDTKAAKECIKLYSKYIQVNK